MALGLSRLSTIKMDLNKYGLTPWYCAAPTMHLLRGFEPRGELDVAIAAGKLTAKSKVTALSHKNLE
jgi:hypothetical protein